MKQYTVAFAIVVLFAFWFYSPVPYPQVVNLFCELTSNNGPLCAANLAVRIVSALIGLALGVLVGSITDYIMRQP